MVCGVYNGIMNTHTSPAPIAHAHTLATACPACGVPPLPSRASAAQRIRTIGYVVLPHGGYPDTAGDYVACPTRADVEAQLVDYGWMDNPGVFVYRVTTGETMEGTIQALVESGDPYPDWVVERGPRGGIQWNQA